jgi:hypothetical protein
MLRDITLPSHIKTLEDLMIYYPDLPENFHILMRIFKKNKLTIKQNYKIFIPTILIGSVVMFGFNIGFWIITKLNYFKVYQKIRRM